MADQPASGRRDPRHVARAQRIAHLFATRKNPATGKPYKPAEVVEVSDLTKAHVSLLQRGRAGNPTADTVTALADLFGVDAGWILGTKTARAPDEQAASLAAGRLMARALTQQVQVTRQTLDLLEEKAAELDRQLGI